MKENLPLKKLQPSFGRRHSKHLTVNQKNLLKNDLPNYLLDLNSLHSKLSTLTTTLEIGFGDGEHLIYQARQNPDTLHIGCEVFDKGIVQCLSKISRHNLQNIKLFTDDARDLLEKLPDNSIDKIFILFPDPWPKKRHHKRRIINQETLHQLARIIKENGSLRIVTDWPDYARWILVQIFAHHKFKWLVTQKSDWQIMPKDHINTKYQQKAAIEGRNPIYLDFARNTTTIPAQMT